MVAVGGSIGTGLLLGSGAAMEIAGPAVILSFVLAAFSNFAFAMAIGELACAHPAAGSFGVYGGLYLNPFFGFLARAGYWVGIALNIGAEMVAASTYMAYWFPGVRSYIWVLIFFALLLFINLRSVSSYGRFEFWFSMIKLITIVAFIVIGASLLLTGRVSPQYTAHGGFFPNGSWAPLVAMTYAVYSFGGGEMVAITSGESRSPAEVRRAVWLTLFTLTIVYLGAMAVLVGVMPWNHAGVTESPFVTTLRIVKIPHASAVMNFVVLSAALSGANAALYAGSRMIFSLARTGWAPARLGRLNHEGSPAIRCPRHVVRHFHFARPRPLGSRKCLPLHDRRRVHRIDRLVFDFSRGSHQFSPPSHARGTRRSPAPLTPRNLGIVSRLRHDRDRHRPPCRIPTSISGAASLA